MAFRVPSTPRIVPQRSDSREEVRQAREFPNTPKMQTRVRTKVHPAFKEVSKIDEAKEALPAISAELFPGSVAIVGSSPDLLDNKFGEEIDSFDHIVRFNRARHGGEFSKFVGSRTDWRFLNPLVSNNGVDGKGSEDEKAFLATIRDEKIVLERARTAPAVRSRLHESCLIFSSLVPSPRNVLAKEMGFREAASSGFAAVLQFVRMGVQPTLFGFGLGKEGYGHFWDKSWTISSHRHNFRKEWEFLCKLHDEGKLTLKGYSPALDPEPKTIFIDIDGTICQTEGTNYEEAIPIRENVSKVNRLFERGNRIVMWTARGAVSGIDWREVTERQLREWGVKHHELRLDKPAFDLFIDDKNLNTKDWR